jgi:hypothetical protein
MHEPEAVTTNVVHVRIDGRNRSRHRDHGLQRVTPFREDVLTIDDSAGVRRANDTTSVPA